LTCYAVGVLRSHYKNPKTYKRDKKINKGLTRDGFKIIRIPENNIKKHPSKCFKILKKIKQQYDIYIKAISR